MKYIWLVLFLAAVFGLCFFADRCIGKVQARAQRRPAVRLPLRYPLLCVLLLLVAPVSAWYGVTHAAPLFVAGAVLLAGISLYAAWTYHRTGIDYNLFFQPNPGAAGSHLPPNCLSGSVHGGRKCSPLQQHAGLFSFPGNRLYQLVPSKRSGSPGSGLAQSRRSPLVSRPAR